MPRGFRKRVPAGCVLHFASLVEEEIESRLGYSAITSLRTLIDLEGSALSQDHLDATPSAFRMALEERLRSVSQRQGIDPLRLRRHVASVFLQ